MKRTADRAGGRGFAAEPPYLGLQFDSPLVASPRGSLEHGLQTGPCAAFGASTEAALTVFCRLQQLVQCRDHLMIVHSSPPISSVLQLTVIRLEHFCSARNLALSHRRFEVDLNQSTREDPQC